MNLLSFVVAGLLVALTLTFAAMLLSAIIFNLKAGRKYRITLATRLNQLRLGKMLSAAGIDINAYLHTQSVVDIQHQMESCSNCENTDTCDEQLADGHISATDIDFCNNEKPLRDLVRSKV
ncbi:MAG: DUF6455 family protein [Thiogranum sp.]